MSAEQQPKDPDLKEIDLIEQSGWYLIFATTPFGLTYPGLLALLIAKIKSLFTKKTQKKEAPVLHPLVRRTNILFISLLGCMYVSALFSRTRLESFLLAFAFTLLFYFSYFAGERMAYTDWKTIERSLFLLFIGGTVASIASLIRLQLSDYPRATLFEGPNSLGTLIVMYTGISIGFLVYKGKPYRYLVFPFLLLSTAAVIATGSRGAWLGFAGMLTSLTLFNRKLLTAVLLIILIAALIIALNPYSYARFLSIFSLEKGGNMSRIYIWQASLKMIKDHPVFGLGLGVFPLAFPEYAVAEHSVDTFTYAHNLFLQIAVELGLVGGVLFFLALVSVYYMAFSLAKTGNSVYQGLFASLLGVLIHQQLDIPIWKMHIGLSFWILVGLVAGFYHLEKTKQKNE